MRRGSERKLKLLERNRAKQRAKERRDQERAMERAKQRAANKFKWELERVQCLDPVGNWVRCEEVWRCRDSEKDLNDFDFVAQPSLHIIPEKGVSAESWDEHDWDEVWKNFHSMKGVTFDYYHLSTSLRPLQYYWLLQKDISVSKELRDFNRLVERYPSETGVHGNAEFDCREYVQLTDHEPYQNVMERYYKKQALLYPSSEEESEEEQFDDSEPSSDDEVEEENFDDPMLCKYNIRNICVVGHLDHGKSTLTNHLIAAAGIDDVQMPVTRKDEMEAGNTIKLSGICLRYDMPEDVLKDYKGKRRGKKYLVNLLDTPGHVELSSDAAAALRASDGAIVVVDCKEGLFCQTTNAIQVAIQEAVRPVIFINKMDRCFLEFELDGEQAYQDFNLIIEQANDVVKYIVKEQNMVVKVLGKGKRTQASDMTLDPKKGNVAFGSGLRGWAFTLTGFAKMYANMYQVDQKKMLERLWGDHFYDEATRSWTKYKTDSKTCVRGFVKFIYNPIKRIIRLCVNGRKEELMVMLAKLNIELKAADKESLEGIQLMEKALQSWLPASSAFLEMVVHQLPSPHAAQKYRVSYLYEGHLDDMYAAGMKNCDPEGPLLLYVSKMILDSDRLLALGRVFSGTIRSGCFVQIMDPNGTRIDPCVHRVSVKMWIGNKTEYVEEVPCGNIVLLAGLDMCIMKAATLSHCGSVAQPLRDLRLRFAKPLVYVTVKCSDDFMLLKGLRKLSMSDLAVKCIKAESGQFIMAVTGERHLKVCLEELRNKFMRGAELVTSDLMVFCRETVLERSRQVSFVSMKRQQLFLQARPLEGNIPYSIEKGWIGLRGLPDVRLKFMAREYKSFGWNKKQVNNILSFGPNDTGPNILLDVGSGVKDLDRESIVKAFQLATSSGGLAQEEMRGIVFEVSDVALDGDAICLGDDLTPTNVGDLRKLMCAAQRDAKPRLLEPLNCVEVLCQAEDLNVVSGVAFTMGGFFIVKAKGPRNLVKIEFAVPVLDSFRLPLQLRDATSGRAIVSLCQFFRWNEMSDDPLDLDSNAGKVVSNIRERKGLEKKVCFSENKTLS